MSRQMTPHALQALREWNQRQPAWHPIKRYEQLTPAQQSEVDDRAAEIASGEILVTNYYDNLYKQVGTA